VAAVLSARWHDVRDRSWIPLGCIIVVTPGAPRSRSTASPFQSRCKPGDLISQESADERSRLGRYGRIVSRSHHDP
jgi:hypothetical protein